MWSPCALEGPAAGSTGEPPSITSLLLPTCNYLVSPGGEGEIIIEDPDADADNIRVTYSLGTHSTMGQRLGATETPLEVANRTGTGWQGTMQILIPMASEGTYAVKVKVADREGGQSRPYCGDFTVVR